MLLFKDIYLYLRNIPFSKIHKDCIKLLLNNFDIESFKIKILKSLKKYKISISSDIMNILLSYKIMRRFNKGVFSNNNFEFYKNLKLFYNEKNNLFLSFPENNITTDYKKLYESFINNISITFHLNSFKLNLKEEILLKKNLNLLIFKSNFGGDDFIIVPYKNNYFIKLKQIFFDTYKIHIPSENYCFIFLLKNIILRKKIKQLKNQKILIFLDSFNHELTEFLRKEINKRYKIYPIIFETKIEVLDYIKNESYILLLTNDDSFSQYNYLKYCPEKHHLLMWELEEFIIFHK